MRGGFAKKIGGTRERVSLSRVPKFKLHTAVEKLHEEGYSISQLCRAAKMSRQAYYQYRKRSKCQRQKENERVVETIIKIHYEEKGIFGYRMMQLHVNKELKSHYNLKRIYRLMRLLGFQSVTRKKRKTYILSPAQHTEENLLNREFTADDMNEKWLTDITEFEYGNKQKVYLCAILDLYDRSIVAYNLSTRNDTNLVFDTVKDALNENPGATPMIHSDRGFQFTSFGFKKIVEYYELKHSMSRVGCCLDNAPMEGFWGKLKSEKYYLKDKYASHKELTDDIHDYIDFYNNRRLQRKLNAMAPMEYRSLAS
ncbi:MAG: IS3 family transposase [Clostridiaceae bacterium]|nr:IS3 family transposase [Clostridiaceae bacterium]